MNDLPPAEVIAQAVARAAAPNYERWIEQVHAAGCCIRPVRLKGAIRRVDADTGELQLAYTTTSEPDRVLLKACQTRRAGLCPACAAIYRGDARAIVLAGLAGGKGNPATIAEHPAVFATLTAPSSGAVHTAHDTSPCHPRPDGLCAHGRKRHCTHIHTTDDPAVGTPLCADCYDYPAAIIWNANATGLWARTCINIRRGLAADVGLPVRRFTEQHQLNFVKVIEYQRRGVIHVHAALRLDHRDGSAPSIDAHTLAVAVQQAARRTHIPNPHQPHQSISWGPQLDTSPISQQRRTQVAGYIAKYATKSVHDSGVLDRRLRDGNNIDHQLPEHLARLLHTAWHLGGQPELADLNLRAWAHTLGYRGHWLTKSRNWSTTFTELRDARHHWQQQRHSRNDDDGIDLADWTYQGIGHHQAGDQWLARSAANAKQLNRRTAWEERS